MNKLKLTNKHLYWGKGFKGSGNKTLYHPYTHKDFFTEENKLKRMIID